jgi:hypothetical protein
MFGSAARSCMSTPEEAKNLWVRRFFYAISRPEVPRLDFFTL